jgi:hypothetical protein
MQIYATIYVLGSLLTTVWAIPTLTSPLVARQSGTLLCTQAQIDADYEYESPWFPDQSFDLISNLTYIVPAPQTARHIHQTLHISLLSLVMRVVLPMLVSRTSFRMGDS